MKMTIHVSSEEIAALVLKEVMQKYALHHGDEDRWECELYVSEGSVVADVKEVPQF